jgi:hypothetical protein
MGKLFVFYGPYRILSMELGTNYGLVPEANGYWSCGLFCLILLIAVSNIA